MTHSVHGLILSAGASSRMGRPKALLRWEGETFVARLVRLFDEAGCASVNIVLGAHADLIGPQLPRCAGKIIHEGWARGMRSSLRAGLAALPPGGVLLTHVDRPVIEPQTLLSLLSGTTDRPRVPYFDGQAGHPVFIPQSLRPRLMESDEGSLREILTTAAPERLLVPDRGILFNINTPEDFARVARSRE